MLKQTVIQKLRFDYCQDENWLILNRILSKTEYDGNRVKIVCTGKFIKIMNLVKKILVNGLSNLPEVNDFPLMHSGILQFYINDILLTSLILKNGIKHYILYTE